MINKHLDYIIVGQGLAGSVLSFLLQKHGYEILVIDQGHTNTASKAAAGLINPITGRYYTKSWKIEELIDSARKVYTQIEADLACTLWYDIDIFRALHTIEQVNDWSVRVGSADYTQYAAHTTESPYDSIVTAAEGIALIKGGARVDISLFIEKYRNRLASNNQLLIEAFDYDVLDHQHDSVSYKGFSAKGIIFCEGYNMTNNPFFSTLPIAPAKGESLHIGIDTASKLDAVMKHQQYLVPIGNGMFWSGGGFKWNFEDESPTAHFKEAYIDSLSKFINTPYVVVQHNAGVRPCVKDRKPLIGTHPKYDKLYLFNGMGTKGTSLAPYFAEQFIAYLTEKGQLDAEIDLERYISSQ